MRIISGIYKGRRLMAPKTLPVRPTTDFAKEGLFNILNNRIDFHEVSVLDLFSGTGNIAYEFASRGCKNLTCVDADFGCIKYIKKVSEELNFNIQTFKMDAFKYVSAPGGSFDVIFADPPYAVEPALVRDMIQKVFEFNWLKEDGMLVVEHPKSINFSDEAHFIESRKYGGSVFSFFE